MIRCILPEACVWAVASAFPISAFDGVSFVSALFCFSRSQTAGRQRFFIARCPIYDVAFFRFRYVSVFVRADAISACGSAERLRVLCGVFRRIFCVLRISQIAIARGISKAARGVRYMAHGISFRESISRDEGYVAGKPFRILDTFDIASSYFLSSAQTSTKSNDFIIKE